MFWISKTNVTISQDTCLCCKYLPGYNVMCRPEHAKVYKEHIITKCKHLPPTYHIAAINMKITAFPFPMISILVVCCNSQQFRRLIYL